MNAVSKADIAADERIAPNISVFMGFSSFFWKLLDFTVAVWYTQVVEKRIHARSAEVGWVLLYRDAGRIYSARRGEEYTGLIGGSGSVCLRVYYILIF